MNKKLYMQPETLTMKIETSLIIAASPNSISEEEAGEGDEENPVNFSRRRGLWDDED